MIRLWLALLRAALGILSAAAWMPYSGTLRDRALNYFVRCVTPAALTSAGGSGVAGAITMALHTGDPGASGTTAEVSGGSYARQNATFNAASSQSAALSADVPFAGMPAATVTHMSIWDKAGTPLFLGGFALTASKTVGAGDTLTITAAGTSATMS